MRTAFLLLPFLVSPAMAVDPCTSFLDSIERDLNEEKRILSSEARVKDEAGDPNSAGAKWSSLEIFALETYNDYQRFEMRDDCKGRFTAQVEGLKRSAMDLSVEAATYKRRAYADDYCVKFADAVVEMRTPLEAMQGKAEDRAVFRNAIWLDYLLLNNVRDEAKAKKIAACTEARQGLVREAGTPIRRAVVDNLPASIGRTCASITEAASEGLDAYQASGQGVEEFFQAAHVLFEFGGCSSEELQADQATYVPIYNAYHTAAQTIASKQ